MADKHLPLKLDVVLKRRFTLSREDLNMEHKMDTECQLAALKAKIRHGRLALLVLGACLLLACTLAAAPPFVDLVCRSVEVKDGGGKTVTKMTQDGDVEVGRALKVKGVDVGASITDFQARIALLETRVGTLEKKSVAMEAMLAAIANQLAASKVSIAAKEYIFSTGKAVGGTQIVGNYEQVQPEKWGKTVLGVVLVPRGNPGNIVDFRQMYADVAPPNQIKLFLHPIEGRNSVFHVRAIVFYHP